MVGLQREENSFTPQGKAVNLHVVHHLQTGHVCCYFWMLGMLYIQSMRGGLAYQDFIIIFLCH